MDLYNNKKNDTLKFSINSEGIDTDEMEARLILYTKENKNYIFFGEIDGTKCTFDIPELNLYEKDDNGKIKFEIISEDVYFNVWDDKFEIKTKPSVKLDEAVETIKNEERKPKITATPIVEKVVKEKNRKPTKKKIEKTQEDHYYEEDGEEIIVNDELNPYSNSELILENHEGDGYVDGAYDDIEDFRSFLKKK